MYIEIFVSSDAESMRGNWYLNENLTHIPKECKKDLENQFHKECGKVGGEVRRNVIKARSQSCVQTTVTTTNDSNRLERRVSVAAKRQTAVSFARQKN